MIVVLVCSWIPNPGVGVTSVPLSSKVILASIAALLIGLVAELTAFSQFSSISHSTVHAQTLTDGNVDPVVTDTTSGPIWNRIPQCDERPVQSNCFRVVSGRSVGGTHSPGVSDISKYDSGLLLPVPLTQPPSANPPANGGVGTGSSESGRIQLRVGTVHQENQAPEIFGEHLVAYAENGTDPVGKYTASDQDGDSITWSLLGYDREKFAISEEGILSFRSPPDYEKPEGREGNTYWVTLRAEDDGEPRGYDVHNVRVTVTQINELGEVYGNRELSLPENHTGVISRYQVEDPEGGAITWSLSGADSQGFKVDSSGNLALVGVLDFESPSSTAGSNVHYLTVTATDDGKPRLTAQMDITVTVVDETEAPVATAIPHIVLTTRPMSWMVDLRKYFIDPDGDRLVHQISGTASTHVAHAAVDGGTLSITPAGEGNSSFYIVATDPGGLRAINKVFVQVISSASAPRTALAEVNTPEAPVTHVPNSPSVEQQETPSAVEPIWVLSERRYRNVSQQPDGVPLIFVAFAIEPVVQPIAEMALPHGEVPAPPSPLKNSPMDGAVVENSPSPQSAALGDRGHDITIWLLVLPTLIATATAGFAVRMFVIHRL